MALDIYAWLTYRMSYLKRPVSIPWAGLQAQFGAGYAMTPQGQSEFKRAFSRHLKKIAAVYPDARVTPDGNMLRLSPSNTHVKRVGQA